MPIPLPDSVELSIGDGNMVVVKGPKGTLTKSLPSTMTISVAEGRVEILRQSDAREQRALHGLTRQLLANMVTGVTKGFEKRLEIRGTGYRASLQGRAVDLQLGFSHPRVITPPDGVEIQVPDPTHVVVQGIDKQVVGHVAALVRDVRPADAYKGKGVRYSDEYVIRKEGKKK